MLPADVSRCSGMRSLISPTRPHSVCLDCARRTHIAPDEKGALYSWIYPPIARDADGVWRCAQRIDEVFA